ncbi:hypothetical protein [Terasakiella sp.]|uniref:hypothetical protein n=1 Tax=Terasakiella sp. TaxID=2034861 RepID=UPI003AA82EA8
MKLYRDEQNIPRVEAEPEFAILAEFLEDDIQSDKVSAIELLNFLEKKRGERVGNAFCATFDDQNVTIECLFDDSKAQSYTRNIFFQAVEAWIVFIND